MTLEEYYKDDPGLLEFYKKKLLIRGWQPHMNAMEREYVQRMKMPWVRNTGGQRNLTPYTARIKPEGAKHGD